MKSARLETLFARLELVLQRAATLVTKVDPDLAEVQVDKQELEYLTAALITYLDVVDQHPEVNWDDVVHRIQEKVTNSDELRRHLNIILVKHSQPHSASLTSTHQTSTVSTSDSNICRSVACSSSGVTLSSVTTTSSAQSPITASVSLSHLFPSLVSWVQVFRKASLDRESYLQCPVLYFQLVFILQLQVQQYLSCLVWVTLFNHW